MSERTRHKKSGRSNYSVSLSSELDGEVERASEKLDLSKQDTIRQAIKLGLPHLLKCLGVEAGKPAEPALEQV